MKASSFIGRIAFAYLLTTMAASAAPPAKVLLPPEERTNGRSTLASLARVETLALGCCARLESVLGRAIGSATIVAEDGYLLAKASELPELEKVRARFLDARVAEVREVHREPRHDLVLMQAIGVRGLRAASFGGSHALGQGHWLCAAAEGGQQLRLGVLSAQRRRIPGLGAALGIRMSEKKPEEAEGVLILGIASESPAEAAGLMEGDILTAINEQPMTDLAQVNERMRQQQPGDVLEVRLRREGELMTCRVRLASRSKVLRNWEGEDFANGGVSLRTDGFSEVLQHHIPLFPADMGGPLSTLEGKVIGINIARVDRVTTFALPMEAFWMDAQQWIQADRHPPKAEAVDE
jgi:serine protease Do